MLSGIDQEEYEQWMRHGLDCEEPGLQHFDRTINGVLSNTLEFFKVARLFNPKKALEMNLDAAAIDCLGVVPFLMHQPSQTSRPNSHNIWQRLWMYLQTMILCTFGNSIDLSYHIGHQLLRKFF